MPTTTTITATDGSSVGSGVGGDSVDQSTTPSSSSSTSTTTGAGNSRESQGAEGGVLRDFPVYQPFQPVFSVVGTAPSLLHHISSILARYHLSLTPYHSPSFTPKSHTVSLTLALALALALVPPTRCC